MRGLKRRLAATWDAIEQRFDDAKDKGMETVADIRAAVEEKLDEAWESPTERRLKNEVESLSNQVKGGKAVERRLQTSLDTVIMQRNVLVALLVAVLATWGMVALM